MSNYRAMLFVAVVTTILCQTCTYGGPARSLATVVAARTAKIPRSIRAPFRNTEMMTARGFGKRSQQMLRYKDDAEIPWPIAKHDTTYFDDINSMDSTESVVRVLNGDSTESYPIDWLVHEILGNPNYLRSLLERFVDTNRDGQISSHELIGSTTSTANDLF